MKLIGYCMAAIAALTALPAPASAKFEIGTGNDFLTHCSDYQKPSFTSGICFGFLEGFIARDYLPSGEQAACLPSPSPTNQQIMDVVLLFLRNNPTYRHREMGVLTWHALHEAFPCPKGRK